MPRTLRLLTALIALGALVIPATPAEATFAYGSIVDKNDTDFQPSISVRVNAGGATTKVQLPCFVDADGNGVADMGDPIYLALIMGVPGVCGQVNGKYLRLTPSGIYAAGTEVKATDSDFGMTLTQLGTAGVPLHALRVFKVDADPAKVKKVDTVYLDLQGLASLKVGIGDVRLTPYGTLPAGSYVKGGDIDANNPLVEMAAGVTKTFYSAATGSAAGSVVYEYGKSHYINVDLDATTSGIEEGDVRLSNLVPNFVTDLTATIGNPGKIVDSIRVTPDVARPGETVEVKVTVKNISTKIGSGIFDLKVDDEIVASRATPTLNINEAVTMVIMLPAPLEAGRHSVQAGDAFFAFDVEGTPVAGATGTPVAAAGPSQADFDALNAKVATLEAQLAALKSAPLPAAAEVETLEPKGAPATPFLVLTLAVLAIALMLRRKAA